MVFRKLEKGRLAGLIVGVAAISLTTCFANAAVIAIKSTLKPAIASPNSSQPNASTSEPSTPSVPQQNGKTGNLVIKPQFDEAGAFSSGRAWVRISNTFKRGYIDKTGDIVIPGQFDAAWDFSEGLALVRIGDKLGYISR